MSRVALKTIDGVLSQQMKEAIVDAAMRIPSGDNCQPFRFEWEGDVLHVYHIRSIAQHYLNIDYLGSYLSLGCLLESVRIKGREWGVDCDWKLSAPIRHAVEEVASVRFFSCDNVTERLTGTLEGRYTDRRCYQGSDLAESFFAPLQRDGKQMGSYDLHVIAPNRKNLVQAIGKLDQIIWTNRQGQQDLQRWLRITPEELKARDGMPWRTLGVGQFERWFLWVCRRWWVQRLLNSLGALQISRGVLEQQIASSGYLCLITTRTTTPVDVINAGRLTMRTWLQLNHAGHGVQPLSLASFMSFAGHQGHLDDLLSEKQLRLVQEVDQELRAAFGLAPDEQPVWLMRTGAVPDVPDYLRAPRIARQDALHTQ